MKHRFLILFLLLVFAPAIVFGQTISISAARALPVGSTVTVQGVITNGAELGTIRYMQDGTGGMAMFSSQLSTALRGDNVTVTGVTLEFQNLLEISPVNSWVKNSSGNPLPLPVQITPNQLDEPLESQLVSIQDAVFSLAGNAFQGNTNYTFTSNGQSGVLYIRNSHPLVGQVIPSGIVHLDGICSQFGSVYQLLPRDANDLVVTSSIYILNQPTASAITTSGFNINWTTNISGSTFVRYGNTIALELGIVNGVGGSPSHSVSISGGMPADIFYARSFSVNGNDTAVSAINAFATTSLSTGNVKAYFNRTVNNAVANPTSNLAIQLPGTIDDTLAAYIDRVQSTLDMAIYNLDNTNTQLITQAINNAYARGVQVRMVVERTNANAGLPQLNPAIPVLKSLTGSSGIMHNKFMVIDADATNPNIPIVWTGSTNWTGMQITTDHNNVVIIQDQSLAKAYKLEFEEMWGSAGAQPDTLTARFGTNKTNNTPHEFVVGGKRMQCYFSPSDNANARIIESMNTANVDMQFAVLSFTRSDIASAVVGRVNAGVYTLGMVNDTGSASAGSVFNTMKAVMGNNMLIKTQSGTLHHKYLIVDQSTPASDPQVLTGSHNWSNSANNSNDENTLVIHDGAIANQFYQEFVQRFTDSGGIVSVGESGGAIDRVYVYPNPAVDLLSLHIVSRTHESTHILVTDLQGRQVISKQIMGTSGQNIVMLDVAHLAPGLYAISFVSGGSMLNSKFVIAR